ncbi:glycine betaine ABC transporter substrate-binding protein [Paenibacillus sp. FA6]|uniref:glycine betaine ABC transporter substrate-binding protein n=1 Tax=Paenibacillus sp. FA6 TaxID=3413029 RepID=UPI003F65CED8
MVKKKMNMLLLAFMAVTLVLAGCSNNDSATDVKTDKKITLAFAAWDSEIASTNVVKEILQSKLNYKVEMLQVDAGPMYVGVADGTADAMVAAWLPSTHGENYYEPNKDKLEDLGANLDGTKSGLAVPAYMVNVNSIEDLNNEEVGKMVNYTITGTDPGAGLMLQTQRAVDEYDLKNWNILESSAAAMVKVLQNAYANEEPIIFPGWSPHWMFADMDLKYLDDPKGVYGGSEQIHTLVRLGLKEDAPDAYRFLDQFQWEPADMEAVMIDIDGGMSEEDAAKKWIAANETKVNEWVAGIE